MTSPKSQSGADPQIRHAVGFWRFLETLGERGLKASFAVNGSACRVYEPACRAALDAGWDFVGHGFVQKPMHRVEDQAEAIGETVRAITEITGRPPRGWESPGLTETIEVRRAASILEAAGGTWSRTGLGRRGRPFGIEERRQSAVGRPPVRADGADDQRRAASAGASSLAWTLRTMSRKRRPGAERGRLRS